MAEWDYDMDYDITMKTPLGKRYGTMHVEIRQGQMSGSIVLLNHKKPFRGTVDREGNFEIEGTLISLIRKIPFRGRGKIDQEKLYLQLQGERNTFEVRGAPTCQKIPPQFAVHR